MIVIGECDGCGKIGKPCYSMGAWGYNLCPDCLLKAVGEMRDYLEGHSGCGCGAAPAGDLAKD